MYNANSFCIRIGHVRFTIKTSHSGKVDNLSQQSHLDLDQRLTSTLLSASPRCGSASHLDVAQCLTSTWISVSPRRGSVSHLDVAQCLTATWLNVSPRRGSTFHLDVAQRLTSTWFSTSPRRGSALGPLALCPRCGCHPPSRR